MEEGVNQPKNSGDLQKQGNVSSLKPPEGTQPC